MSEERLNNIEDTIKELSAKVVHLDKSFSEINITLRDYASWTKELSQTIKELSSTVKEINNTHQQMPYERIRDIQTYIDPIFETLRKHEEMFIQKKELARHISISTFFLSGLLIISGLFIQYVMDDVRDDIITAGKVNKILIERNAKNINTNNISQKEILQKLHEYIEKSK